MARLNGSFRNRCTGPVLLAWVLLAGAVYPALRSPYLDLDEAYSALISGERSGTIIAACRYDNHPPLFYLLISFVYDRNFPQGARIVSWLAMLLTAIPLLWLGQRFARGRRSLLLLILVPLSVLFVFYATYLRMYALLGLAELLALAGYCAGAKSRRRWWLPLGATAAVLTHHLGLLFVLVLFFHALAFRRNRLRFFILPLLIALAWNAWQGWLPLHTAVAGNQQLSWLPPLTARNLFPTIMRLFECLGPGWFPYPASPLITILVVIAFALKKGTLADQALLVSLWCGPTAALLAVSLATGQNHLVVRALYPAQLIWFLMLVRVFALPDRKLKIAFTVLIIVLTGYNLNRTLGYLDYTLRRELNHRAAWHSGPELHTSTVSAYPFIARFGREGRFVLDGPGIVTPRPLLELLKIPMVTEIPPGALVINCPEAPGAVGHAGYRVVAADYLWDQPVEYLIRE